MYYRAEIDGLRAIAVLPVILYHAGLPAFSGGYIGVDVFFVISGYLITGIIYPEISGGTFSIVNFYERRARRILPALFFVVFCSIFFAWNWMLPDEFIAFSNSIIAVNLFSSNILFWQESGYFELTSELKPLLHTWSLAVEEQFYIIFPILVLLIKPLGRLGFLTIIGLLVLASLALSQWSSEAYVNANFYLLPTRAWELGIGALLALFPVTHMKKPIGLAQVFSLVGICLIMWSIFTFDETVPFPSLWALIPVIGTALVLGFGDNNTIVGRLLSIKPLVGVGLISYSAYLWHQPLFAFCRIRSLDEIASSVYLILSLLSLVLAYFSWRFVEQPFRDKNVFGRNHIFLLGIVGTIFFISFGIVGSIMDGVPSRFSAETITMLSENQVIRSRNCSLLPKGDGFVLKKACRMGDFSKSISLWGDSHARALAPDLSKLFNSIGLSMIQLTPVGCTPVIGYEWKNKNLHCIEKTQAIQEFLLTHTEKGDVILLHGRWTNLMWPTPFDNGEGGRELELVTPPIIRDAPYLKAGQPGWISMMQEQFYKTVEPLLSNGRRIVLIYSVPEVGWHVPKYLARQKIFENQASENLSTSYLVFKERSNEGYRLLDSLGDNPNLLRIYPEEVFCNTTIPGRCMAQEAGVVLYADDDHLGHNGTRMLSELVINNLKLKGWI